MITPPHIVQARAACLRCAVDVRTTGESADTTIDRARKFEAYVVGDNADGAADPKSRKAAAKAA